MGAKKTPPLRPLEKPIAYPKSKASVDLLEALKRVVIPIGKNPASTLDESPAKCVYPEIAPILTLLVTVQMYAKSKLKLIE